MKGFVLLCMSAAAIAAANPVMRTIVSEFGFADDSLGWVELHVQPLSEELNLTGWLLATNTSACTLACTIPSGDFLIVDSASLAEGTYAHGTFRLHPAGDRIELVPDSAYKVGDGVEFPVLPAGHGQSPLPPILGSASVLNVPSALSQTINWYVDSTPTAGMNNDDYSSVTGTVTWAPSRNFYEVEIAVHGPTGGSYSAVAASGQSYLAQGLGAGRYAVTAHGQPGNVVVSYPDSVDVGYSQTLPNINLEFDPDAIAESFRHEAASSRLAPTVLSGTSGAKRLASCVVFDATGRRVLNPRSGILFVREPSAVGGRPSAVRKVVVTK